MKNILGLDLGSNSIGWAIVKALKNEDGKEILQSIDLDYSYGSSNFGQF